MLIRHIKQLRPLVVGVAECSGVVPVVHVILTLVGLAISINLLDRKEIYMEQEVTIKSVISSVLLTIWTIGTSATASVLLFTI